MGGSIPVEELDKMSTLQVLDLVQERLKFMGVPSQDHQPVVLSTYALLIPH